MFFFMGVGIVVAYGGSNPSVQGHSAGELDGVCLSDGTNCLSSGGSFSYAVAGSVSSPASWANILDIGQNRDCFAYIQEMSSSYLYIKVGCKYIPSTGYIQGKADDGSVTCAYVCFD